VADIRGVLRRRPTSTDSSSRARCSAPEIRTPRSHLSQPRQQPDRSDERQRREHDGATAMTSTARRSSTRRSGRDSAGTSDARAGDAVNRSARRGSGSGTDVRRSSGSAARRVAPSSWPCQQCNHGRQHQHRGYWRGPHAPPAPGCFRWAECKFQLNGMPEPRVAGPIGRGTGWRCVLRAERRRLG
jgi:hypothetical protein